MRASLQNSLLKLSGSTVAVSPGNGYPEPGQASVLLLFGEGTKLQAEFWRLIEHGRASFSSFDHQQKYGLPVVIDAIQELRVTTDLLATFFVDQGVTDLVTTPEPMKGQDS